MTKRSVLLFVCGILGMFIIACSDMTEESASADERSEVGDPASDLASDLPEVGTSQRSEPGPTKLPDGDAETLAKNCSITCSTANNTNPSVPCGSIVGFGSTTFLGGCTKACRFAREDAVKKASAIECHLTSCGPDVCN